MRDKDVAMKRLKAIRESVSVNTYRTIRGQIIKGDVDSALVGITRIEQKLNRR